MPPLFGFGGLLPPGAPPPGLTPQQLAGMSVLLQQQQHAAAVAAAMFSGGFPPLDPAALAAAMQGQFAMAASAASQMQMLQGQLNGQLGGQPKPPFGHLPPSGPPFGPPFGGAALFRPPSAGNLADQLGCGPAMREPSTQQQTQADDGERSSLGRHSYERQQRDAGVRRPCSLTSCATSDVARGTRLVELAQASCPHAARRPTRQRTSFCQTFSNGAACLAE